MSLTPKERMRNAIRFEPVDRVATQINYTNSMGEKLAAHYQVKVGDLPELLDNHMRRVDLSFPEKLSEDGTIRYDWWGVGFDTREEGYFTSYNPLADSEELNAFAWPDPDLPSLFEGAQAAIVQDHNQHFITSNLGFCLFERAWSLRGFQQLLVDMADDPIFVEDLLERITDIQVALIHRFIASGVDGGYFGDDYGSQSNLLLSPRIWRRMLKPRLAKMFAPFREAGLPIIMHSDGQISAILPDLVEIGLTTLNPVQPEMMEHQWLKSTFGNQLSFYGGISTQTVLPSGSPTDVKEAVRTCIDTLAPDKTGLVIAPSHRMMADISVENVDALREAFLVYGGER